MRIAWVIYGALEQMTGGYLYDCEIVRGLRAIGHDVLVWSLPEAAKTEAVRALVEVVQAGRFDVCVGDELCFRELGPAFEALAGGPVAGGGAGAPAARLGMRWNSAPGRDLGCP